MPTKDELLAHSITVILQRRGIAIDDIVAQKVPDGFWVDVCRHLELEGHKFDIKGDIVNRWSRSNKHGVRTHRKEIMAIMGYDYDKYNHYIRPEFKVDDKVHTLQPQGEYDDERIRAIVREEISKFFEERDYELDQLCPEPGAIQGYGPGVRTQRVYQNFSSTVDIELWKIFTAKRKRLRTSTPRLLDTILWEYFGRPSLSFQKQID